MRLNNLISLQLLFTILSLTRADEISESLEKILRNSSGENLAAELTSFGISEDKLRKIINYCEESDEKLSCLIMNIYKTIFLNKHNYEVCLSWYIIYTGMTCLDNCLKEYRLDCLECVGEHIPFIFDCLSNGHIDYRPDSLN